MLQYLRDQLGSLFEDDAAWAAVATAVSYESVSPGAVIRRPGDRVTDVLVVERGLFEVSTPHAPARWATQGAIIGIAASVTGAESLDTITARRFGRVARIPAHTLWDRAVTTRLSVAEIGMLTTLPDRALTTLPPDPFVITLLLEDTDDELTRSMMEHLRDATDALVDAHFVCVADLPPFDNIADMTSTIESKSATVAYVVHGTRDAHAADLVAHADRVLILQEFGSDHDSSAAFDLACDGAARRHTELIYIRSEQAPMSAATQRLQLPPNVTRTHVLLDQPVAQLQRLLSDLRAQARDYEVLREFEVFSDLSDAELASIQRSLRWERIDGGSTLLRQGDSAQEAWLLRAGRLEAIHRTTSGDRHVTWYGPGAFIAEMSLVTGGKRTNAVRAVRDSTVARLTPETLDTLFARSADFTRQVTRALAPRPSGRTHATARRARTLSFVPFDGAVGARACVSAVAEALTEAGLDTVIIDADRLNAALGPNASNIRRGEVGDADIIGWLDQLERQHDVVILMGNAVPDSFTRRAVRQCDHLVFIANASSETALRPLEHELIEARTAAHAHGTEQTLRFLGTRHLLLLQPSGLQEAVGTGRWLAVRPEYTHHHVRDNNTSDVARLARRLTGRAVALALSGASSRVPAHAGVVRAIQELDLPIDVLSGSSSGSAVASMMACGFDAEQILAGAIHLITNGPPRVRQFQPPITALTSGATPDRTLQSLFGDRQLEDQFVPTIITAVDIRRHRAVHLTRGPIWKLVRASGSLPLIWPPVWHEDDLLVDGAIITFLPVEVFGDQADQGLIIASNLDETAGVGAPAFEGSRQYGTVLNGWYELLRRFRGSTEAPPPGLVDILYHTMAIPSFQQLEGLAALAERENVCLLTPPIGSFGVFEVNADVGRRLEQVAWEHARGELKRVAARWHSRLEWRTATTAVPT